MTQEGSNKAVSDQRGAAIRKAAFRHLSELINLGSHRFTSAP